MQHAIAGNKKYEEMYKYKLFLKNIFEILKDIN